MSSWSSHENTNNPISKWAKLGHLAGPSGGAGDRGQFESSDSAGGNIKFPKVKTTKCPSMAKWIIKCGMSMQWNDIQPLKKSASIHSVVDEC